jgi:hypothetical protein
MTVELPKDAEGREIPLDTALLYGKVSGEEYEVVCFIFRPSMGQWRVGLRRRDDLGIYATGNFTLSPPDTWEKLLDDLDAAGDAGHQGACAYLNGDKDVYCRTSCPGGKDDCVPIAMRDISDRIRKLRGGGDE